SEQITDDEAIHHRGYSTESLVGSTAVCGAEELYSGDAHPVFPAQHEIDKKRHKRQRNQQLSEAAGTVGQPIRPGALWAHLHHFSFLLALWQYSLGGLLELLSALTELQQGLTNLVGILWQGVYKCQSAVIGQVAYTIHTAEQQSERKKRASSPWYTPSLEMPHNGLQHKRQQQR